MNKQLYKIKAGLKRSYPTILTFLGVIGVAATGVAVAKATPKAIAIIEHEKRNRSKEHFDRELEEWVGDSLTTQEVIALTWKCYIPSALIGLSSIACIIGINVMSKRNQASLASAYAMLSESYKQYRGAANAVYGENADAKIQAEMAKETYISADGLGVYSADMDPESEKILCYDMFSQRYFTTTMAAVVNAQYHINRNLQLRGYTSINEFYEFLGLDGIEHGDEIAWDMSELMEGGIMWLDFENHRTKLEDGLECCIISAVWEPNKFDGELDIS